MNNNLIKFLLSSVLLTSMAYAEFGGFGYNEEPKKPQTQKSIPAKQVIIQNRKNITTLNRKIDDMEMKIEGLMSLVEGMNSTIAEMKMNGSPTASTSTSNTTMNDGNTALIKELGLMIDKINNSYVSKNELSKILKGKKVSTAISSPRKKDKEVTSVKKQKNSTIYSEGVRLYIKHRYTESEKRFTVTDKNGYKPAASNYYLGEICYYTKKYNDAIFHYKKSASLYDQANYIDVLLLHTAISLEKTGDKEQARSFYENIVENYSNKKSAKIAKSKLKKL